MLCAYRLNFAYYYKFNAKFEFNMPVVILDSLNHILLIVLIIYGYIVSKTFSQRHKGFI